jgi:hypothetical protein
MPLCFVIKKTSNKLKVVDQIYGGLSYSGLAMKVLQESSRQRT